MGTFRGSDVEAVRTPLPTVPTLQHVELNAEALRPRLLRHEEYGEC